MIKTFTENDLIKYVYEEANEIERNEIDRAAKEDFSLRERVRELQNLINKIDQLTIKVSTSVVDRVLYASRNFKSS